MCRRWCRVRLRCHPPRDSSWQEIRVLRNDFRAAACLTEISTAREKPNPPDASRCPCASGIIDCDGPCGAHRLAANLFGTLFKSRAPEIAPGGFEMHSVVRLSAAAATAFALASAFATEAGAVEIKVLNANALTIAMREIAADFTRETGHQVTFLGTSPGLVDQRVRAG